MTDYSQRIDAETWAFIHATEAQYPAHAATLDIAGQRAVYDRMARAFHRGRPAGVAVADRSLGGVPCRLYTPAAGSAATVVYLHGGGFVVGGLESHDDICAELAAATECRVVSADYRLAPEHPHPAAFDDALAATRAVAAAFPGPLVMAGDSAGGNLAAAVSHAARRAGPPVAGQVLIYPGLAAAPAPGGQLRRACRGATADTRRPAGLSRPAPCARHRPAGRPHRRTAGGRRFLRPASDGALRRRMRSAG